MNRQSVSHNAKLWLFMTFLTGYVNQRMCNELLVINAGTYTI